MIVWFCFNQDLDREVWWNCCSGTAERPERQHYVLRVRKTRLVFTYIDWWARCYRRIGVDGLGLAETYVKAIHWSNCAVTGFLHRFFKGWDGASDIVVQVLCYNWIRSADAQGRYDCYLTTFLIRNPRRNVHVEIDYSFVHTHFTRMSTSCMGTMGQS
jgi:hypothetical protein